MTQVTINEAKEHLHELLAAARRGEMVVIGEDQATCVRLVPVQAGHITPQFGSAKGKIEMSDDFDAPLDDFQEYV